MTSGRPLLIGLMVVVCMVKASAYGQFMTDTLEGSGLLDLLFNRQVVNDIGLEPENIHQLVLVKVKFEKRIRDTLDEDPRRRTREDLIRITKVEDEIRADLKNLLNEEQMTRLRQIQLQIQCQRGLDAALVFVSDDVRGSIGISEEQLDELLFAINQQDQELQTMVANYQYESSQKVLAKLKPDQRESWTRLVGHEFKFVKKIRGDIRPPGSRHWQIGAITK
jgi:hypothetical protein